MSASLPMKTHGASWLPAFLSEYNYRDPRRVMRDVTQVLSVYKSLVPTSKVQRALNPTIPDIPTLLLSGAIPISVQSIMPFSCRLQIEIPQSYPLEAPHMSVSFRDSNSSKAGQGPDRKLDIRPNQYVNENGKVQHPYLMQWRQHWDKSSLLDFLDIICGVLIREPPLKLNHRLSSPKGPAVPLQHPSPIPPPVPPPPAELLEASRKKHAPSVAGVQRTSDERSQDMQIVTAQPPPRPLKINEDSVRHGMTSNHRSDGTKSGGRSDVNTGYLHQDETLSSNHITNRNLYERPPPPLPSPNHQQVDDRRTHAASRLSQGTIGPPSALNWNPSLTYSYGNSIASYQNSTHNLRQDPTSAFQLPATHPVPLDLYQPPTTHFGQNLRVQGDSSIAQAQQPSNLASIRPSHNISHPQPLSQRRPPPPDLLSSPLDVTIPSQQNIQTQQPTVAPPIPPNPEKDALTSALSASLRSKLENTVRENLSAIAPLVAQNQALHAAHARLQSEMEELSKLENALSSNEQILRDTTFEADRTMEVARRRTAPEVDAVLVAPTAVGNQLYSLCAEEAALKEALFVLAKGADRGRMETDVFVKQTRNLAREQFLKKALIKKIGRTIRIDGSVGG